MTNEEKARELYRLMSFPFSNKPFLEKVYQEDEEDALCDMAVWKDEQPILELGGWHQEEPTEDGWYLIKSNDSPKNCDCMVAEWDDRAKHFYAEADDEPVSYREWKLIERACMMV